VSPTGRRLVGLALPPALLNLCDNAATLAGQSKAYWAGDFSRVNEASPTFHHLLTIHPAAFIVGGLGLALLVAGLVMLLPDTLALTVSIAVTVGHTVGVATWLAWRFEFDYQIVNGLILLTAALLAVCIRYGWRAAPADPHPLGRWPAPARYLAAAGLFAVGVYLFLWPRSA